MHISGLDAITTKDEIQKAIAEQLAMAASAVKVQSIRPAYGDTQKATVEMEEDSADRLIGSRVLRIG